MERIAYSFLTNAENSWWYRGRRFFVERALGSVSRKYATALDFGAGFGACFSLLSSVSPVVDAYEIDAEALEGCTKRGYRTSSGEWSDFRKERYHLVGAFDVIEHLEDDREWLTSIHTQMESPSTLVLSVPAFQWMWSVHDETHKHFRRYTVATISKVLEDAGFKVVYATYWNCALFPVAYILRLVGGGGGENLTPSTPVNWCLTAAVWLESRLVPYIRLLWGTGIIVLARKK